MDSNTTTTAAPGTTTIDVNPGVAPEAVLHFYVCLADRDERESLDRLLRHRQLVADIEDAARRADAVRRLELALSRGAEAA